MKQNRTTLRTIELLKFLSTRPDGATLTQAAKWLDVPVTSLYNILQSLLETGFVELKSPEEKTYVVGLNMFIIGNTYMAQSRVIEKSADLIKELSLETGKTVFVGKYINNEMTYIYKQVAEQTAVKTCEIGTTNDLHCTAMGKVIMAFAPDNEYDLSHMTKYTKYTITDMEGLLQNINEIKEKGYAIDDREHKSNMICFSAPIYNYKGEVEAAISLSGAYTDKVDQEKEGKLVRYYADRITARM